jgi:DHA1 family multidrug resistance protein-like MFS transporter
VFKAFKEELMILFSYSQLFPLCFAVFVSMLGFGLVMPLLPIYARDFGATGTQLGFLTASFAIARLITTFPGGWLADRAGRKKPIILGLLAYSVVMALYGFSQDVNQLILLRGLQGMASGVVWPVISTMVVDKVLPSDRSKAIGLYEMMHFLGMVVGPGLGGVLAGMFTVAVPFLVCGVLAFFSSLIVALTVQETATKELRVDDVPAEIPHSGTDSKSSMHNKAIRALRELTPYTSIFVGLCLAQLILVFSNALMQPVLSVYANEEMGISEVGVGMLFTVQGIVTLLATVPMGIVADEVGRKPIIVLGKIIHAVAALLVILSGSFWPLLFVMTMRGFGRSMSNPSITAMFSGLVPISKRGRGIGIFNLFRNVGLVVGSTVGGFLYEFSSSEAPFIACAGVGLIGVLVVLLMVSEPKQGLQ